MLFKTKQSANKYRTSFKKSYGYKPNLFDLGKGRYKIIKPKRLIKIK